MIGRIFGVGLFSLILFSSAPAKAQNLVPEWTVGVGFGFTPGELLMSSEQLTGAYAVGFKLNLSPELVIEPVLSFAFRKEDLPEPAEDPDATYGFGLQGIAKYALAVGERTRFYPLGGLGFGFEGAGDATSVSVGLVAGGGLEYFFTKHISLSLDVISPLLVYTHRGNAATSSTISLALQSTQIRASLSLYF